MEMITANKSKSVEARFPEMRFTALSARIDVEQFKETVEQYASSVAGRLAKDGICEATNSHVASFEDFFSSNGLKFPLRSQIEGAKKRGFPPVSKVPSSVVALLALEAETGVLMGVQNLDAVREHVTLDLAANGEVFEGMSGRQITCKDGELVVRDADGIIASVFQGPDKRTQVSPATHNLLFYIFDSVPTISGHDEAVDATKKLLREARADFEELR